MNRQSHHQELETRLAPTANATMGLKHSLTEIAARRRLCVIVKVVSSTLDPHERQGLRLTIRRYVSSIKLQNQPPETNFVNALQERIRSQVGDRRWSQCEAQVDRFIQAKKGERQKPLLDSHSSILSYRITNFMLACHDRDLS
jgi:hypothetical protein